MWALVNIGEWWMHHINLGQWSLCRGLSLYANVYTKVVDFFRCLVITSDLLAIISPQMYIHIDNRGKD